MRIIGEDGIGLRLGELVAACARASRAALSPASASSCSTTGDERRGGRSPRSRRSDCARRRRTLRRPARPRPSGARPRRWCAGAGRSRASAPVLERRAEPFLDRILDEMARRERRGVDLLAHLHGIAPVDEDRGLVARGSRAMPAEPAKPVSQARRSSDGGQYSFWCSSDRGTTKPSSPHLRRGGRAARRCVRRSVRLGDLVEASGWS